MDTISVLKILEEKHDGKKALRPGRICENNVKV
jgi:hypothetical protein